MYHKYGLSPISRVLLALPRASDYTYKPLNGASDAIRLILLQPAPFRTSSIHCQVVETTWSAERAQDATGKGYSALSYTWGDLSHKSRIEIDGRHFQVTKNLERALRHLRLEGSVTRLWADGVCINQEDVEERNLHVSQMREIYNAATQTTIFLGEATEGSDALLSAIQNAAGSISEAATRSAVLASLVKVSGMRKLDLQKQALNILWRSYWKRIWIFQEIVVSANPWVQCGGISVPWEMFCQAVIALLGSNAKTTYWGSGYSNEPRQRLEDMYWERRAYRLARGHTELRPTWNMGGGHEFEDRMKLLDLLVTKRGSQATDSRDMIFAVSGIATKPKGWSPLSITYEKSVAGVYMDAVKYVIEHDNSYEVLSHAGISSNPMISEIPSWAPDWRIQDLYRYKIVDWVGTPTPVSESLPDVSRKPHVYLEHHSILACLGHTYSTIASVSADTSDVKPSTGSIGRVIWTEHNKSHHHKLREYGISPRLGTVRELLARSHPLTYRRKVASTKGRTLCLVPQEAEEGDIIALFEGSRVPFVLRPWTENSSREEWFAKSLWSKIRRSMYGSRRVAIEREEERKRLDEDIEAVLKAKNPEIAIADKVKHFQFIGECYIDGLVHGQDKKSKNVFALH